MLDLMLDLETMGVKPNAAIAAIGAVFFDIETRTISNGFYIQIDLASSVKYGGGKIDPETVIWWMQQGEDARAQITAGDCSINVALNEFRLYIESNSSVENVRVWGNGAAFDNVVLRSAYEALCIRAPWDFRNDRCYRTIKAMHPEVTIPFEGTRHHAIHDARHQARHLIAMLNPGEMTEWA